MKKQNLVNTVMIGIMILVFIIPSLGFSREIGGAGNCAQGSDGRMVCGGGSGNCLQGSDGRMACGGDIQAGEE